VCVCVFCSPGGEWESGRKSSWSASKFTAVRMQMEFPADYTEVKQTGPDKRKTSRVLLIRSSNGANGLARLHRGQEEQLEVRKPGDALYQSNVDISTPTLVGLVFTASLEKHFPRTSLEIQQRSSI